MRRWAIVVALVVVAPVVAPGVAHAESEAERLYEQGQDAYDELRYDDALAAWQRSYALSKLPALLFNIAQAQRLRGKPGDCTRATANYRKFIAALPKSSERPTAEGFIAELAPCVEREAKTPAPVPPAVVRDDRTPVAGTGEATSGTTGGTATTRPTPATLPARRDEGAGRGKRVAGYALGGAGVALVLTGVYFGAKARRLGDEVSDECSDGCDWNLVKDKDAEGKSAERTQYILYGVGLGVVAAGGVLYYLGGRERSASTVAVTPTASGGAAISWSGAW